MDRYDASHDHYCYPASPVLKNKLNIQDMDDLEAAERDITAITVNRVQYVAPPYSLDNLKQLHHLLFSDLYEWAGNLRSVDISKGGTRFCTCARIEAEAAKIFASLQNNNWLGALDKDAFCGGLAEYYCELNMIHPFREGNGRVQRILFEHLALSAGYELDWATVSQAEWVSANIDGVNVNYGPMKDIFERIVTLC
ncbi:putative adenosine monophosphate-protein transferase Fic [Pseudomonas fragariae (ex Marin et al. 2024)]|uniref:protein adenylyltransferase n=2 Tax=Pseudomonas syringae group TaxID=136849 RepID=A0A3M5X0G9_9PSED|nr:MULTISPECIES: putative adenosine monophosphate-protein transferase Fic [Pseudomonas]AKF48738.1 Protein involved in cell division [Pseudomonas syringae pv. syringae B301D]EXL32050.1 cell filamentation protein Fic [Pseudomonas syringae pv. syringae str. B301D-R]KPW98478.1 Cell filamentation protein Fic [Pseudomonas syringae pv. coryli]MCH5488793.1 putative adenosine monophosphate-protein transferase Fic [Pseudomonas syringae pv. syringae]MCH5529717.1 putative adenosine monophosphate-protein t